MSDRTDNILERIAVALEARKVAPTQDTALSILNQENEHLRAEIATLKALNAGQHAANVAQRQELAMLRPLLVDGAPSVPGWPAPQPIETAPLSPLMAWDPSGDVSEGFGPAWVHELPNPGMTVEEWRALLKMWGRTKWLPMPPPGGGK